MIRQNATANKKRAVGIPLINKQVLCSEKLVLNYAPLEFPGGFINYI